MANTFELQLAKFAEKASANVETVVRKTTGHLAASVVLRSPVGLPELWAVNITRKAKGLPLYKPEGYVGGRFRGNWNVSIGSPDLTQTAFRDQNGSATISRASSAASQWKVGDIYLTNSLPYGPALEYEAHSTQVPKGMVRITVTEFQTFIDQAVAELPK